MFEDRHGFIYIPLSNSLVIDGNVATTVVEGVIRIFGDRLATPSEFVVVVVGE